MCVCVRARARVCGCGSAVVLCGFVLCVCAVDLWVSMGLWFSVGLWFSGGLCWSTVWVCVGHSGFVVLCLGLTMCAVDLTCLYVFVSLSYIKLHHIHSSTICIIHNYLLNSCLGLQLLLPSVKQLLGPATATAITFLKMLKCGKNRLHF